MKGPLNIATRAALQAGRLMMQAVSHEKQLVVEKKDVNDYVTSVDQAVERSVVRELRKAFPDYGIISEEGYADYGDDLPTDPTWIIDPIDGTCNFIHGIPMFAVSIGLMVNRQMHVGVIYNPYMDELYTATKGKGAYLNDRRIRVSHFENEHEMVIAGCYPSAFEHRQAFKKETAQQMIAKQLAGHRILGSAALSLAYVAAGRLDGYYHAGQKIWDVAAGVLLVTEAGGFVSDFSGGHQYLVNSEVVAANRSAFRPMLQIIKPAADADPG